MPDQALGLIHEFDARITVSRSHEVGGGPYGRRQYFEITSVEIQGGRIEGSLLGSAGDWMLVGQDGSMRMDVRLQVGTEDGAVICVHYFGPVETSTRMREAMEGGLPTTFPDQRIRTHWLLETGDPRYAWVNLAVFVGESRVQPGEDGASGFVHRVYRVDRP